MSTSPRFGFTLWDQRTYDADVPNNDNLARFEAFLNVNAVSVTTTAEPAVTSANAGQIYVLPTGRTGTNWATAAVGSIALVLADGTWEFYAPKARTLVRAADTGELWIYTTAWVTFATLLGSQGAALTSAATVTLANATGDYVHVTGVVTITSFGTAKAGIERVLVHDAAHILTHSANIINLGGANITTAAGDISRWRSEGGTVWRMVDYVRASGGADLGTGTKAGFWRGDKTFTNELQNDAGAMVFALRAYGGSAGYNGGRINGTPGAPTATLSGDQLTSQAGYGHDGTSETTNKVRVRMVATQDWTPTSTPTKITFDTTAIGSTTLTQRWSVEDTGDWLPTIDATYDAGSATYRIRAVFTQTLNLSGAQYNTGITSPAAMTADTNDLAVSSITRVLRLSSDATQRSLTGIGGGASGRRITLFNINASTPILLKHDNAGSSASNRIALGGADVLLAPAGGGIDLWYDSTSARWRSSQTPQFGTYTPTLTNVTNVAASTAAPCQWMRVGNVVTVSGQVNIDPTAVSVDTHLGISLPIPSTFTQISHLGGTAVPWAVAGSAGIYADTTNNRASLRFAGNADAANRAWHFHFTYLVL